MKLKYFFIALLALVGVASVVIASRKPSFAAIDLGNDYTMRFYAWQPGFLEDRPTDWYALDYELSRGSSTVWRRRFGGTFTLANTLQFQVLTSSDRTVVAIVEAFAPDIVLDIRDLITGEGWPDQADHENYHFVRERGHRLLARLQPGIQQQLILSHEVKGRQTRL